MYLNKTDASPWFPREIKNLDQNINKDASPDVIQDSAHINGASESEEIKGPLDIYRQFKELKDKR